ncbi:MAG: hypothetical protein S4CHLAM7_05650 [Chlamydiae bacterium]|nr:hypothetical protein [Chlamydiota bacterium]
MDSRIKFEIKDEKKPNNLYTTFLMLPKWEHSLAREICYQETSKHYYNTLATLSRIQGLI